jgi:hypothetical protein
MHGTADSLHIANDRMASLCEIVGCIAIDSRFYGGLSCWTLLQALCSNLAGALEHWPQIQRSPTASLALKWLEMTGKTLTEVACHLSLETAVKALNASVPYGTAAMAFLSVAGRFAAPHVASFASRWMLGKTTSPAVQALLHPWVSGALRTLAHFGLPRVDIDGDRVRIQTPWGTSEALGGVSFEVSAAAPEVVHFNFEDPQAGRSESVRVEMRSATECIVQAENKAFQADVLTYLSQHYPGVAFTAPPPMPFISEQAGTLVAAAASGMVLSPPISAALMLGALLLPVSAAAAPAQLLPLKHSVSPRNVTLAVLLPVGASPEVLSKVDMSIAAVKNAFDVMLSNHFLSDFFMETLSHTANVTLNFSPVLASHDGAPLRSRAGGGIEIYMNYLPLANIEILEQALHGELSLFGTFHAVTNEPDAVQAWGTTLMEIFAKEMNTPNFLNLDKIPVANLQKKLIKVRFPLSAQEPAYPMGELTGHAVLQRWGVDVRPVFAYPPTKDESQLILVMLQDQPPSTVFRYALQELQGQKKPLSALMYAFDLDPTLARLIIPKTAAYLESLAQLFVASQKPPADTSAATATLVEQSAQRSPFLVLGTSMAVLLFASPFLMNCLRNWSEARSCAAQSWRVKMQECLERLESMQLNTEEQIRSAQDLLANIRKEINRFSEQVTIARTQIEEKRNEINVATRLIQAVHFRWQSGGNMRKKYAQATVSKAKHELRKAVYKFDQMVKEVKNVETALEKKARYIELRIQALTPPLQKAVDLTEQQHQNDDARKQAQAPRHAEELQKLEDERNAAAAKRQADQAAQRALEKQYDKERAKQRQEKVQVKNEALELLTAARGLITQLEKHPAVQHTDMLLFRNQVKLISIDVNKKDADCRAIIDNRLQRCVSELQTQMGLLSVAPAASMPGKKAALPAPIAAPRVASATTAPPAHPQAVGPTLAVATPPLPVSITRYTYSNTHYGVLNHGLPFDWDQKFANPDPLSIGANLERVCHYYSQRALWLADTRTPTSAGMVNVQVKNWNNKLVHSGLLIPELVPTDLVSEFFTAEGLDKKKTYFDQAYFVIKKLDDVALKAMLARRLVWFYGVSSLLEDARLGGDMGKEPVYLTVLESIVADIGSIFLESGRSPGWLGLRMLSAKRLRKCRNAVSHMTTDDVTGRPRPDNFQLFDPVIETLCTNRSALLQFCRVHLHPDEQEKYALLQARVAVVTTRPVVGPWAASALGEGVASGDVGVARAGCGYDSETSCD